MPRDSERYRLDDALGFWLHVTFNKVRNAADAEMKELAVTPEQWAIMVRLWERDDRSQNELADVTFRDRPSVSRMIDGLERAGYVVRGINSEDRRSHRIVLTQAGRALEGRLVPRVRAFLERLTRGIAPADLETTRRTLQAIYRNLE
jgi:DNA-binding MarR family transcriptional regulator